MNGYNILDNNETPTIWAKASTGIDMAGDGSDVFWAIRELKTGVSSNTGTFIGMGTSMISKAVSSYGEYTTDGILDGDEINRMVTEASVSGLWKLCHLDLIDEASSFLLRRDISVSDYVSTGLNNGAAALGTTLGNTILDHPTLKKIYDKGFFGEIGALGLSSLVTAGEGYAFAGQCIDRMSKTPSPAMASCRHSMTWVAYSVEQPGQKHSLT